MGHGNHILREGTHRGVTVRVVITVLKVVIIMGDITGSVTMVVTVERGVCHSGWSLVRRVS